MRALFGSTERATIADVDASHIARASLSHTHTHTLTHTHTPTHAHTHTNTRTHTHTHTHTHSSERRSKLQSACQKGRANTSQKCAQGTRAGN